VLNKRLKMAITTPSAISTFLKDKFGLGAATIEKLREEKDASWSSGDTCFRCQDHRMRPRWNPTIVDFVDQILVEALRLQAH